MTDVILQLRSKLVEEIQMTETFAQISNCLLNSFLMPYGNHCCHSDGSFPSFPYLIALPFGKFHGAEVTSAVCVTLCGYI